MKCTRCLAELPVESRFCLRCGTPVPTGQATPPELAFTAQSPFAPGPSSTFARPANRGLKIAVAVLVLAIAGLTAAMVRGGLLHAPGRGDNGSLVNAPGESGMSSLVQAPGESHSGPLVQSPGSAQAPPDLGQKPGGAEDISDIVDYLKFLRGIEADRKALQHSEYSHVQTMIPMITAGTINQGIHGTEDTSANGDPKIKDVIPDQGKYIEQIHVDWQDLSKRFVARQPPTACVDLRNKYLAQLGSTEAGISKAVGLIESMSKDPSAALQSAYAQQGTSGNVDAALADADDELSNVFRKYGLRKNFDISDADAGGGNGMFKGLLGN